MKIYQNATELIGKTPLLELTHIEKALGLKARILAKLEYFNPRRLGQRQNCQGNDRRSGGACGRDSEQLYPRSVPKFRKPVGA